MAHTRYDYRNEFKDMDKHSLKAMLEIWTDRLLTWTTIDNSKEMANCLKRVSHINKLIHDLNK